MKMEMLSCQRLEMAYLIDGSLNSSFLLQWFELWKVKCLGMSFVLLS